MTEKKPDPKVTGIRIKVEDDVAPGRYANMAVVTHSDAEFVLDFIFLQPGRPDAKVNNRVILAPKNAKRLAIILNDHIAKYEKRFGKIPDPAPQDPNQQVNLIN